MTNTNPLPPCGCRPGYCRLSLWSFCPARLGSAGHDLAEHEAERPEPQERDGLHGLARPSNRRAPSSAGQCEFHNSQRLGRGSHELRIDPAGRNAGGDTAASAGAAKGLEHGGNHVCVPPCDGISGRRCRPDSEGRWLAGKASADSRSLAKYRCTRARLQRRVRIAWTASGARLRLYVVLRISAPFPMRVGAIGIARLARLGGGLGAVTCGGGVGGRRAGGDHGL
jgi:hypothetical protein